MSLLDTNASSETVKAAAASDNSVTVYYKKGYAKGCLTPHILYRTGDGFWGEPPGVPMQDSEIKGYAKAVIELGAAGCIEACFNDGGSKWDSNRMKNYWFEPGVYTFHPASNEASSTILQGVPEPVQPYQDDWSKKSIYFILTDRFWDGDSSNNDFDGFVSDKSDPRKWHGGDFQGIIDNLDYIQNMGFDAIWITPVTRQKSDDAFHGYYTYDFYDVDGHFGGMDKLKELVKAAHERQIAIMLDVVINHTGNFQPDSIAKAPFDKYEWYHHNGDIQLEDYMETNQWALENCDIAGLDDLNHENIEVANELKKWIRWMISETNVDALRIDTTKHVPKSYLREFTTAANTFTFGEVYGSEPSYLGDYSNYVDAALDFPMYYTIEEVFGKDASMLQLQARYNDDHYYRDALLNGTFVDNHDVKRFLYEATGDAQGEGGAHSQLKAALSFLFTSRGIPILYQGTEQGFSGGCDPANREDMILNTGHELYKHVARLNAIRRAHPALQNGTQTEKYADDTFYGFQRSNEGDEVVVLINNAWVSESRSIEGLERFADGTKLYNQLGEDAVEVANGSITAILGPKEVKIFTK